MEIKTKELARVTIVELHGRVDHQTAPAMAKVVNELLRAHKYNLIVDLSDVGYLASAGLRILFTAHKETQGKQRGDVRLVVPSELIMETLKLVGFTKVFKIYPNLVEAVGSF